MREFMIETFIPVIAHFVFVAVCILVVIFGAAVAVDFVSDPFEIAEVQ